MNLHEQMRDMGREGSTHYTASEDVVADVVTRTKRARAMRQGGTTIAGSVGAMVLALVSVQAVAQVQQDPADQGKVVDSVPVIEKYGAVENTSLKGDESASDDLAPVIEDATAAAQAALDKEREAAEQAAEEAAAKKKAEDEAAAAQKQESSGDSSKDSSKPKETSKPKEECTDNTDEYEYKYYDCSKGKWITKNGWIVLDKYYTIVQWTDAATGSSAYGAYSAAYDKIGIASSTNVNHYDVGYTFVEGRATWSGNVCTGTTKDVDGTTKQFSCLTGSWVTIDSEP